MTDKRNVLITGVTRGLGCAMVREFIERGHTVMGCGRGQTGITALQKEFGPPHSFDVVDVSADEEVAKWAQLLLPARGAPELLLNNAAIVNRNAALWQVSAQEFSEVVDVNLKGVANVIRHFVPAMIQKGRGIIVNFSSGWGRTTDAEVAPYCATKWAIEGLTQALAQELPPGLAAVPLNPGIIDTEMLRSCFGGSAARFPTAAEWARVAVPFLLKLDSGDSGKQLTVPIRGARG